MASGQYLAFFALVAWAVVGTVGLVAGRLADAPIRRFGRDLCWLAVASAAAALACLPLALPYLRLSQVAELPSNVESPFLLLGINSVGQYVTGNRLAWFVRIAPPTLTLAVIGIVSWSRTAWRRALRGGDPLLELPARSGAGSCS